MRKTDKGWTVWTMNPDGEEEQELFALEGEIGGSIAGNSPAQPGQTWLEQRIAWK